MSELKTYTLEQLCIVGSSKRVHLSDYVQQGVPFYRSKEVIEISSGKNISEQLFISSENAPPPNIKNRIANPIEYLIDLYLFAIEHKSFSPLYRLLLIFISPLYIIYNKI